MTTVAERENPFAGQGSVLLDIGGDIGALVVTMPATMVDVEVEIRPAAGRERDHGHDHRNEHDHDHDHGDDRGHGHHHGHGCPHGVHHPHVAVVERPVEGGVVPSLVFPELVEGSYELHVKGTSAVCLLADVAGGEVTTTAWPG